MMADDPHDEWPLTLEIEGEVIATITLDSPVAIMPIEPAYSRAKRKAERGEISRAWLRYSGDAAFNDDLPPEGKLITWGASR